jgi:hypothetical protein
MNSAASRFPSSRFFYKSGRSADLMEMAYGPADLPPATFRPAYWGQLYVGPQPAPDPLSDSVTVDVSIAAEGLLSVGRCTCGGRIEVLSDLRGSDITSIDNLMTAASPGPGAWTPSISRWILRHRLCGFTPINHSPDPRMNALAESAWSTASECLEHAQPVIPVIDVLMDTGAVLSLAFDIPLDRAKRQFAVELVAYQIREFARSRVEVPVGAVAVVESWMSARADAGVRPTNDPCRREGLYLMATTRTRGVTRLAPVRRLGGVPEHGPAAVELGTNRPLSEHCMLDGLLAAPHTEG